MIYFIDILYIILFRYIQHIHVYRLDVRVSHRLSVKRGLLSSIG